MTDIRNMVITGVGGAEQVGATLARYFAAAGWRVHLLGLDQSLLDAAKATLPAASQGAAIACDLTVQAAVERAAAEIARAGGDSVHAVVLAAGGFAMSGPVADADIDTMNRQLSINLMTAAVTTKAMLPAVRRARGALVYFASDAALPGGSAAGKSAYVAAKSALVGFMRAVAEEEGAKGVRANAVAPTAIRTRTNLDAMGDHGQYVEMAQLAGTVEFLCGDGARAMTGQVVRLAP